MPIAETSWGQIRALYLMGRRSPGLPHGGVSANPFSAARSKKPANRVFQPPEAPVRKPDVFGDSLFPPYEGSVIARGIAVRFGDIDVTAEDRTDPPDLRRPPSPVHGDTGPRPPRRRPGARLADRLLSCAIPGPPRVAFRDEGAPPHGDPGFQRLTGRVRARLKQENGR
jgi:hypothetical protein